LIILGVTDIFGGSWVSGLISLIILGSVIFNTFLSFLVLQLSDLTVFGYDTLVILDCSLAMAFDVNSSVLSCCTSIVDFGELETKLSIY